MRGLTKKPCHGCGKPDTYRPTEGVCTECRATLAQYPSLVETIEKIDGETPLVLGFFERFGLRIYGPNYLNSDDLADLCEAIQSAVAALCQKYEGVEQEYRSGPWSVLDKSPLSDKDSRSYGGADVGDCYFMPPEGAEAVRSLVSAIREALELVGAAGVKRGKSILLQLADGDLSLNDFDPKPKEGR